MKLYIVIIIELLLVSSLDALPFTHYTSDYLRLRSEANISAQIITVLEPNLGVEIVERGRKETIDNISAEWVKVIGANGYTGWCFSGYLHPLEKDISDTLAKEVDRIKAGSYPKQVSNNIQLKNVTSIIALKKNVGFYIQQQRRRFQGSGRAPEILQLVLIDDKVLIREIDIIQDKIHISKEIKFKNNGNTFSYNKSKIKIDNNDMVYIFYMENKPEKDWLGTYEYEEPYTKVSDMKSQKLLNQTSDILKSYVGVYAYDSNKIIKVENEDIQMDSIHNAQINIHFNEEKKCLSVDCHDLIDIYQPNNGVGKWTLDFIETSSIEPFFWTYGEGAGYSEAKFWFYKGGIAISYENQSFDYDDDHNVKATKYMKYVVFLRKEK